MSATPTIESPEVEIILVLNDGDEIQKADEALGTYGFQGMSICDEPGFNFPRKCNLGAAHASGEILVFLNDDTDMQTIGWSSHIISLLQEDDVACVGGMLLNLDRTVQSCGDNVGRSSAVHYAPEPFASSVGDAMHRYIADHETTSVTGAFFCCRKEIFEDLGGFTLAFPNSFQDVDFCLRARSRGMRCLISPHVRLLHFESVTRNPRVDISTLTAVREFHRDLLAPSDTFAFHRYEKINVSLFTLTGIRHHLSLFKQFMKTVIVYVINYSQVGARAPRGILKKVEWHVH